MRKMVPKRHRMSWVINGSPSMIWDILVLFTSVSMGAFGHNDWQRVSSQVHDGLHDVFFLNDSLGWAHTYGTSSVIYTCDAGKRFKWPRIDCGASPSSMKWLDSRSGIITRRMAYSTGRMTGAWLGKNARIITPTCTEYSSLREKPGS